MVKHLRTGIAVSLLWMSIISAGALTLSPRFVDHLQLGILVLLGVPIIGGGIGGIIGGRWVLRLARLGTDEDIPRAYELIWASLTALGIFAVTLPLLPSFISLFSGSETIRYGGGLVLACGFAYLGALIARYVANRFRLWIWPLLLALPVVAILAGATPWGRGLGPGSRVLVLAFPGLSWNVAEDMIEQGEMPNLASLRRSGAWGDVQGVGPLLTPVVWTSVATGKTAESHQVMGPYQTAEDVRARRIWQILGARGWSVGLFGWPVTWPPEPVDGFVVPAVSDLGTEAQPRELNFIREIAMSEKTQQMKTWGRYWRYAFLSIRYGVRLGTLIEAGTSLAADTFRGGDLSAAELFAKRKLRSKLNCDFFVEARRKWAPDFAAYHSNIVHVAQSHFWKYHEPRSFRDVSPEDIARYGESVHDSYRIVDRFIGRILADAASDDLVVVISDHGAEPLTEDVVETLTLRLEPLLLETRLKDIVEGTNLGARTFVRMRKGHEGNLNRVRRLFDTARLSHGGSEVFHTRVDEWHNLVVTVSPEVNRHMDDVVLFQGGRCPVAEVIRAVEHQESAQMKGTGALVLSGEGVRPGTRFADATLLDLVPTLLMLTGLDLAADLPGVVIYDALHSSYRDRIPGVVATYEPD